MTGPDAAARRRFRQQVAVGALILLALNYYIIRDGFHVIQTGHMNSMHGFWMGLARLADVHWFRPAWWPYLDAGSPFEFIYAPLVPGLTALWSWASHIPISQAFFCISSLIYLLGPVTLFLMAAGLTRAPWPSLAAGILYTLTSPTGLLVPDTGFPFHQWDDRRLYLTAVWDDTPHMMALMLLPLALLFLARACTGRRTRDIVLAILLCALTSLASAFGSVLLVTSVVCLLLAFGREQALRHLPVIAVIGIVSYLIASPFMPPSVLHAIRESADNGGQGWTISSWTGLALVTLIVVLVLHTLRRWNLSWQLRFIAIFAFVTFAIPAIAEYAHRQFLPQPGRYRMEIDLGWSLLIAFIARYYWNRLPRTVAAALALLLIAFAVEQTVSHRKYAKDILFPAKVDSTIEYKVADWLHRNMPHQRVLLPGSINKWHTAFSDNDQFGGSSWATAYNPTQQMGESFMYAGSTEADTRAAILWLKAFGVQAITVVDKTSGEFWKPYTSPARFASLLEPLWQDHGTTIYRVPERSTSYAHVVPLDALVRQSPKRATDTAAIARFVQAIDSEASPLATFHWIGHSHAAVTATTRPGEAVALQVSYHPGWHATVNGVSVPLHRDGLGLMWLQPPQPGTQRIDLRYTGSWEFWTFRVLSLLALLGTLAYGIRGALSRRRAML